MKAWQQISTGTPERAFALRELPDPEPRPNQVLIRSEGFGLNYADTMAMRGLYPDAPKPPSLIGYEVVGRVERCGADVPPGLEGKRVVALTRFGGYGQLACTDHRAVAEIPDNLDLGQAMAMATQGITAWYMAKMATVLLPGQRVLVHAAAGGVGQLLVQLALQQGCEVFAVAGGADKMAYLKELGVQNPIDRHAADYAVQVQRTLGNERLDVSFNPVGGSTFKKDWKLLGSGGRLVLFGASERGTGLISTLRFGLRMGLLSPILLITRSKSIIGVNILRISDHKPQLLADCLQGAVSALVNEKLKARTHPPFAEADLPKALSLLASSRSIGKVVVKWD
ncbi:MAG TPA: zinc-binding dehydrogenase [Flavobacteriales bacterium]|nr:zinc-binding dehydrogenase [Flavobacteriales bacterium]